MLVTLHMQAWLTGVFVYLYACAHVHVHVYVKVFVYCLLLEQLVCISPSLHVCVARLAACLPVPLHSHTHTAVSCLICVTIALPYTNRHAHLAHNQSTNALVAHVHDGVEVIHVYSGVHVCLFLKGGWV